jgi:protein SCO1/2
MSGPVSTVRAPVASVQRFLAGEQFPVFALALMALYELLLVGLLFAPGGESGLGAFADEFRIWCYGWDPATGRFEWGYVASLIGPPAFLAAVVALMWAEPLRDALRRPARIAPAVLAAALIVAGAAASFAAIGAAPDEGELPFPAEALRTAHRAPVLGLADPEGRPVDLATLRGRVVMLTAVYAACPHACPLILAQAKRAVDALSPAEREALRVVAVTLDPAADTPEVLAELARLHSLDAPLYTLATGSPPEVERVLDEMGVSRRRDPETGVIDHANLFLLVDRQGKVAYRLTLGERQERWLVSALHVLLGEPAVDGG